MRVAKTAFLVLTAVLGTPTVRTAAAPLRLQSLAFLTGRWTAVDGSETSEEQWSPIAGDSMTGSFRVVKDGRAVFYEFWAIELEKNIPVYKLKHFNTGLKGWEDKDKTTDMALTSAAEDSATFANANGTLTLRYERHGHALKAVLQHGKGGKEEVFLLHRAP